MSSRFLRALGVVLCVASLASADTVQTKGGETFKGRVVEDTKEQVRLKTPYGVLAFPRAEIARHDRATYRVVLRSDAVHEGQILGETEKELTLKVGDKTLTVPAAEVKEVAEKKPEPPQPQPRKPTPQEIFAIHQRAMDLLRKKEYQKAIEEYEKALKADPEDALALYNTACAHSLLRDKPKALEYLRKAIEAGWVNYPHMEKDADLDGLRDEEAYKELLRNKAEYVRKSTEKVVGRIGKALSDRGVDSKRYKNVYDHERNLVYLHTKSDDELAVIRKGLETYAEHQWAHLFQNKPQQPLYIVLLTAADSVKLFQGRVGGMFNPASNVLFCGDMPGLRLLRTSVVTHEFTHALHFADMQARGQEHPIWLIEGLATLFESAVRNGDIIPQHSYRLGVVQAAVRGGRDIPWRTLVKLNHPQFMMSAQLAYAQSRYMLFYMYEKGLLKKFYDEYTDKANYTSDKSAAEAFEVVFGKPLESVERDWRQWVLKQSAPPIPFLGVQTQDQQGAVVITQVVGDSPAAQAGIETGDKVESIDGHTVKTNSDLMDMLGQKSVGDEIEIALARGSGKLSVKAKLSKRGDTGGETPAPGAAYLGLAVEQKDGTLYAKEVEAGSPAEKAGIKPGAAVLEFNGKKIASVRDYLAALKTVKVGQQVKLKTKQGDAVAEVTVELVQQPPR